MDESNLIPAFKMGNERAFKIVFDLFYKRLLHYAHKYTYDLQLADDLVLPTFQALFIRCNKFESIEKIKAFLYISLRNRCLNHVSKLKHDKKVNRAIISKMQENTFLTYEFELYYPLVESIYSAIDEFPEQMKVIFKLLFFEELKPSEIAKRLNIETQTIYAQKDRALDRLKKIFPNLNTNT